MSKRIGTIGHFDVINRDGVPQEVLDAVMPLLTKYQKLVPRWCRQIVLRWNDGEGDETSSMAVTTSVEYRWAALRVYYQWFRGDTREREEDFIHELCHIPTERLIEFIRFVIEKYVGQDEMDIIKQMYEREFEGTVQDLAMGIYELENES